MSTTTMNAPQKEDRRRGGYAGRFSVGQRPSPPEARSLDQGAVLGERHGMRDRIFACADQPPELCDPARTAYFVCPEQPVFRSALRRNYEMLAD